MKKIKRVGILTGGSGAPGVNAAIYSVLSEASRLDIQVLGIRNSFWGLLNKDLIEMSPLRMDDIITMPGSILLSRSCPEMMIIEGVQQAVRVIKEAELDGLIVIGGDGSMRGALKLCEYGVPVVTIAATCQNDVPASRRAIGFDTAVNVLADNIHRGHFMQSGVTVAKVPGRSCGQLALHAALACRAKMVLIPEVVWMPADIIRRTRTLLSTGQSNPLIVMARGVNGVNGQDPEQEIREQLIEHMGVGLTSFSIKYMEKGSAPTAQDRELAFLMGRMAVELLAAGSGGRTVGWNGTAAADCDLHEAVNMQPAIDMDLCNMVWERM